MSPRPIQELFLEQFVKRKSQLALFDSDSEVKYDDFSNLVFGIAKRLVEVDQQRIAVATKHDFETYASIIAIWLTGKTYVPLDFREQQISLSQKINDLDIRLVLSSHDIHFGPDEVEIIGTRGISSSIQSKFNLPHSDHLAYILSTSGTTGIPKYVPISYSNLNCLVDSFLDLDHGLKTDDRFLQFADLKFDMSIISILIPLCIGASICILKEEENRSLHAIKLAQEHALTTLVCPPSMIHLLKPYFSEISLPHLNHVFFGAETLTYDLVTDWSQCSPNATNWNLYGPSEAGIFITAYKIKELKSGSVPIGTAVKHQNVLLHDANEHGIGEIWVSGPQVFNGYLSDNEKDEIFEMHEDHLWFKTGDLAYQNEANELVFVKRKDRQIKSLGIRQNLEAMESSVAKLAGNRIIQCRAFQQEKGLVISLVEIEGPYNEELVSKINHLSSDIRPARIKFVESLSEWP